MLSDNQTALYYIKLINAALCEQKVSEPFNEMRDVFIIAKRQQTAQLTFLALKSENLSAELYHEWEQCYVKALLRDEYQKKSIIEITDLLTKNNIDLLFMKGCTIKASYPYSFMRFMSDIDVLYRTDNRSDVVTLMERMGYALESWDEHQIHDVFFKKPVLNIEMHRVLDSDIVYSFCDDAWKIAEKDANNPHLYHFSHDTTYLQIITHAASHYVNDGLGIKPVLDLYLYRQKYTINKDKITPSLQKNGLVKFADALEKLGDALFGNKSAEKDIEVLADYIIKNGAYNDMRHDRLRDVAEEAKEGEDAMKSRRRYFFKSLFPDRKRLAKRYDILNRAPWLYAVFVPIRWLDAILSRRKNIRYVFSIGKKVNKATMSEYDAINKVLGMDKTLSTNFLKK